MVSKFISELHGDLRCTAAERDAYISTHPGSHMAARLASEPTWNGSCQLILEPGAAAGKDKYFDAEQLIEQTKLAKEIFEATHFAPDRWAYHPVQGSSSARSYPLAFEAVWCPRVSCMGLFFYDHSSGHGAFAPHALVASRANKGPDWKGSVTRMRDGYFKAPDGGSIHLTTAHTSYLHS